VERKTNLLQIVLALRPASCLAGLLYCGKQQSDQDGDDCYHHQKFNQRKTSTTDSHDTLL
jgi:hypothetical protein